MKTWLIKIKGKDTLISSSSSSKCYASHIWAWIFSMMKVQTNATRVKKVLKYSITNHYPMYIYRDMTTRNPETILLAHFVPPL